MREGCYARIYYKYWTFFLHIQSCFGRREAFTLSSLSYESRYADPSTIYAKVVKVRTIEFIKQQIVFSTLIDTKKPLSLDSIVERAEDMQEE